jgi:hypothetical protein
MIQPLHALVQELYQLNLVCELLLPSGTYVQSFGSIDLSWFSKMAAWLPYLYSDRAEAW